MVEYLISGALLIFTAVFWIATDRIIKYLGDNTAAVKADLAMLEQINAKLDAEND